MEKCVARVEPTQRGQDGHCVAAELRAGGRKKLAHRRDSVGPDEPVDLHPERNKRDQKNQPDRTYKPTARPKILWRPNIIAPEQSRHRRSESAIRSDEFVKSFAERRETRKVIVTPCKRPFAGSISE